MADEKHITVEEDGQILSQATISPANENNEARAQVQVAAGHLPAGTHRKMADALHEAVTGAEHLTACVPRGEAELVEGIQGHLSDVEMRSAGATTIIEGEVKPAS